jgi:hypothetical protein
MKKTFTVVGSVVVIAIAIAAIGMQSRRLRDLEAARAAATGPPSMQMMAAGGGGIQEEPAEVKPTEGPVEVLAYLPPLERKTAFAPTVQKLEELAKKYPKRLQVKIYYVGSEEAAKDGIDVKMVRPSVRVNGRTTHRLKRGGQEKVIAFQNVRQAPVPQYTVDDLEAVILGYLGESNKSGGGKEVRPAQ